MNPSTHPRIALVIGATGSFGGHALCALARRGWTVRALARDPQAAARKCGARMPIDWIAGDAMNPADVASAARGVQLIVHGANPPRYRNWRGLAIPMLQATIAAASAEQARIVLPGNVYNYAPDAGPRIAEDAPQAPVTRKGQVRVEMEAMLRAASEQGAKVHIMRAGDYFGPAAPNSGLGWLTTRKGARLTGVYRPGRASHAYAYLPDLTETMARILDREDELSTFEAFHFAGHWLADGELIAAIRRVANQPELKAKAFPWPTMIALSPFVGLFREMAEMRYLWDRPIGLDDGRLRAFLGEVPATPLDVALRESLTDLGLELGAQTEETACWTLDRAKPYSGFDARPHSV